MNVSWDLLEIVVVAALAVGGGFVRTFLGRLKTLEGDVVELKTRVAVGQQLHNEILHRLEKIENLLEEMRGTP